jgi:hypothetical protein
MIGSKKPEQVMGANLFIQLISRRYGRGLMLLLRPT